MTTELKVIITIGVLALSLFAGGAYWMSTIQNPADVMVMSEKLIPPDSYSLGPATAPLTIVEFGDYQCSSCASTYPLIKDLLAQYPNQIRFVYRHFPLSTNQYALLAAQAAEAAGVQGKYWEMHNWLFENQAQWSNSQNPQALFSAAAGTLGLDVAAFDQVMQNKTYSSKIQQGLADGMNSGVNATPTFFINGRLFQGSLTELKAALEKNLDNLSPDRS